MAYKKLTESGKEFIRTVINRISTAEGNTSLIIGKNSYNLPFSDKSDETVIWKANIIDFTSDIIKNNTELGEYLIKCFELYSEQYNMDANIIAAQAFQESRYKVWNYAKTSTASGISQFIMVATYDSIFTFKFLNEDEKEFLLKNMESPELKSSWIGVLKKNQYTAIDRERQLKNRRILHQNIMDNPNIAIKLQCALMDRIGDRNNNYASSALFAYNRGSGLSSDNYTNLINKTATRYGNNYIKEGVDYVEKIFGYLGDKENKYVQLPSTVKNVWFGYKEIDFSFNEFASNVSASENFNT